MEQWKDIKGYEGLYQVSNEGRVKSLKWNKEKILKGGHHTKGYLQLCLYKDGQVIMKKIHRLVAEAFIPNPNNYKEVNHKDENKENNSVENLEWCTQEYNHNYGTRTQRQIESCSKRVDQIDAITGEVVHKWKSTIECERNGYNCGHISDCCNGKRKTHKGYIWKYAPM